MHCGMSDLEIWKIADVPNSEDDPGVIGVGIRAVYPAVRWGCFAVDRG